MGEYKKRGKNRKKRGNRKKEGGIGKKEGVIGKKGNIGKIREVDLLLIYESLPRILKHLQRSILFLIAQKFIRLFPEISSDLEDLHNVGMYVMMMQSLPRPPK